MDEVHQGEAEVEVVLKKVQGESAKPAAVCEDQQEKTDDQKWARNGHTYLDGGRRDLEENKLETVLRK